jgi:hypothetical protein
MVDAIRLEGVNISFSLASLDQEKGRADEQEVVTQTGRSRFAVKTTSFLNLTVTIHNRSSRPIHPLLRLQPSLRNQPHNIALDLSRRFIWTGMLQHVLPVLGPHETTLSTIGVTALCRGEYEMGASVEEARVIKPVPPPPSEATNNNEGNESRPQSHHHHHHNDMIEDTFNSNIRKQRRVWHARESCIISAKD